MSAARQRILKYAHGFNFRELGGYKTTTGRKIKWNRLIRSAHLADFTASEQEGLYQYGVRTVIDFRSSSEVALYPDHPGSRLKYIRIPVFDNDITESNVNAQDARNIFAKDPQAGFKRMLQVYQQFITDEQAQQAFSQFIKRLCFPDKSGGILFHCSAGKDRTGLATIYVLSLLGIPQQQIIQDYLLTNRASEKRIHERLQYAAKMDLGNAYLNSINDLSTANIKYYQQAMKIINARYGGILNYLHGVLQISDSIREQLKYLYLE